MGVPPVDARAIAQEAYVFGLPPVHIGIQADLLRRASKQAPRGQFVHHRRTPDASSTELLGFNVDTLYSRGIVDVSQEPFVLSVPVMLERYWIVQLLDAWNEVSAAPSARTFGGAGGNFAIVGPRWQGSLPEDLIEIRAATSMLIVAPRIYTSGPADYPVVHALQDQLRLTPLSKWGSAYTPPAAVPIVRTKGFDVCDPTPVSKRVFDRYSLGSRDRMRLDSDGSLRIYIQYKSPGIDLQMNWLPAPRGEFLLAMRLYAPRSAVTDGSWNPPPVMRVDP